MSIGGDPFDSVLGSLCQPRVSRQYSGDSSAKSYSAVVVSRGADGGDVEAPDVAKEAKLATAIKNFKDIDLADQATELEKQLDELRARRLAAKPLQSQQQAAVAKLGQKRNELRKQRKRAEEVDAQLAELGKEKEALAGKIAGLAADEAAQEKVVQSLSTTKASTKDDYLERLVAVVPEEVRSNAKTAEAMRALEVLAEAAGAAAAAEASAASAPSPPAEPAPGADGKNEAPDEVMGDGDAATVDFADLLDTKSFEELTKLLQEGAGQQVGGAQAGVGGDQLDPAVVEQRDALRRKACGFLAEAIKRRRVEAASSG